MESQLCLSLCAQVVGQPLLHRCHQSQIRAGTVTISASRKQPVSIYFHPMNHYQASEIEVIFCTGKGAMCAERHKSP